MTLPPMFGFTAAKSKIEPSSIWRVFGSTPRNSSALNSQPSSVRTAWFSVTPRPLRGSSGQQVGNSVWLPDSKGTT